MGLSQNGAVSPNLVLEEWVTKSVDVVCLDFAKAFDSVNHHRLVWKLQVYGVHPQLIFWIRSLLSVRTYWVKVGTRHFTSTTALSGIPNSPWWLHFYFFLCE